MNRINPIGIYENKYGKRKLRLLERLEEDNKPGTVVFFRKLSDAQREQGKQRIKKIKDMETEKPSFWDFLD